jgi:hypothetical protein
MSGLLLSTCIAVAMTASVVSSLGQAPNVVTSESTMTAKVERIERPSRLVTLRGDDNVLRTIAVDPSIRIFDELHPRDVVKVRYVESVVVQVRPDAALSDVNDTTEAARKAGKEDVFRQLKAVVKIERVDPQGLSIEYRTADGRKILRPVSDKRLLEGVREGDRVEVTLTRERAVSIERVRR